MAGAGLLSDDPETDYMSDVFIGPRPKQLDRSIAIDYTRHGVELENQSEAEIAATFNAEISRAVRYQGKRRDTAEALISMYKRHGANVRQVLEEQVRLNAAKLIERNLENTSLLALAIGQKYLPASEHPTGAVANEDGGEKSDSSGSQNIILKKLDEIVRAFGSRVGVRGQSSQIKAKPSFPTKRDTIFFAAIVRNLEGLKYCDFVDKYRVKPKWADDGPKSYRESYLAIGSYPKRVQDEKSRAKQRMSKYPDSVLMDAFVTYLRGEFDELSSLFNSRNSRDASKKLIGSTGA